MAGVAECSGRAEVSVRLWLVRVLLEGRTEPIDDKQHATAVKTLQDASCTGAVSNKQYSVRLVYRVSGREAEAGWSRLTYQVFRQAAQLEARVNAGGHGVHSAHRAVARRNADNVGED